MGHTPMLNLTLAYRHCQEITRREAKNFAFTFIFLPRPKQRAMNAVYAFARYVDDLADSEELTLEEKKIALAKCREEVDCAARGEGKGLLFMALADTMKNFQIPAHYFHELIEGMEIDLWTVRRQCLQNLQWYR